MVVVLAVVVVAAAVVAVVVVVVFTIVNFPLKQLFLLSTFSSLCLGQCLSIFPFVSPCLPARLYLSLFSLYQSQRVSRPRARISQRLGVDSAPGHP